MTIGIINDVVEGNLASKQDMKDLRQEMGVLGTSISHEMKQMKSELIIRLGTMMVIGIAVISALIKFF